MRLYLIGAGVIARTHAEAAGKLGEPVELHVADPAEAVVRDFAELHHPAAAYASSEAMLASSPGRPDDVVIVATPPAAHVDPAIAAFASGRNVLVEKPLALDSAGAERLLAASERAGRLLGACSTRFRGLPHTEAVKRVMASGELGEPYALSFVTRWARSRAGIEYQPASRWFLNSAVSGGGVVMDWGPYDVSTLVDLLDPVRVEVRDAWVAQPRTGADPDDTVFDVETDAGAALRFTRRDGSTLPVTFGRASGTHATEAAHAELSGTRGAVNWTPFDSQQPVILRSDADGAIVEREVAPPARSELSIFDRPLAAFVDALRGRPSVTTLGAQAVAEFLLLRAIYRAARTGEPQTVEFAS
ncbi:MAG: Gfo/Idh/MocA family protein [Protaetiibacter sp.]